MSTNYSTLNSLSVPQNNSSGKKNVMLFLKIPKNIFDQIGGEFRKPKCRVF